MLHLHMIIKSFITAFHSINLISCVVADKANILYSMRSFLYFLLMFAFLYVEYTYQ